MNNEEKYKNALERARECMKDGGISQNTIDYLCNIFPELKESEDEKIRKEIISALKWANHKGVYDKHITWLEKQGEQKFVDKIEENSFESDSVEKVIRKAGYEWSEDTHQLKKIEPKFKVGDWIVKGNVIYRIDKISGVYLTLSTLDGTALVYHISVLDSERIRPWTINDAEEGDVLASGQVVFMFKMIHGVWLNCYCSLHNDGTFIADSYGLVADKYFSEVHPATKEERDTLFSKMKNMGYEWDSEKKEVKKNKL